MSSSEQSLPLPAPERAEGERVNGKVRPAGAAVAGWEAAPVETSAPSNGAKGPRPARARRRRVPSLPSELGAPVAQADAVPAAPRPAPVLPVPPVPPPPEPAEVPVLELPREGVADFNGGEIVSTTTIDRAAPMLARTDGAEWNGTERGTEPLYRDLDRVVLEKVTKARDWYRSRSHAPRLAFRSSGTLVILVAVAMPLVAALPLTNRNLMLAVMAVIIAASVSLSAFYAWERTWRSRRQAEFALDRLITAYQLRLLEIRTRGDRENITELSLAATRKLMRDAAAITAADAEDFFRGVRWPAELRHHRR